MKGENSSLPTHPKSSALCPFCIKQGSAINENSRVTFFNRCLHKVTACTSVVMSLHIHLKSERGALAYISMPTSLQEHNSSDFHQVFKLESCQTKSNWITSKQSWKKYYYTACCHICINRAGNIHVDDYKMLHRHTKININRKIQ